MAEVKIQELTQVNALDNNDYLLLDNLSNDITTKITILDFQNTLNIASDRINDLTSTVTGIIDTNTQVVANTAKNSYPTADASKVAGIENNATQDQTDAEIETAYNNQVAQVSAGEITAGTETAIRRFSPADVKGVVDANPPTFSSAFGSTSRNGTEGSGTVVISGLGFTPRYVNVRSVYTNAGTWSVGSSDGSNNQCVSDTNVANLQAFTDRCIHADDGSDELRATITIQSDGFSLVWTEIGTFSTSGQVDVIYEAHE